ATNRAILESMADPAAAIAATKVREPILNEAVELERWRITQQYIAAADTKGHGLGDVLKRTLEEQVDEVVSVFGLKARPSVEGVFNRAMLPAANQRTVKV
ncbi:MAG: ABC transporter permease, partial [Hydrogenophaga sp.]|nr:ABC transporter permease [Hydrogenophaga sp.]